MWSAGTLLHALGLGALGALGLVPTEAFGSTTKISPSGIVPA